MINIANIFSHFFFCLFKEKVNTHTTRQVNFSKQTKIRGEKNNNYVEIIYVLKKARDTLSILQERKKEKKKLIKRKKCFPSRKKNELLFTLA